MRFFDFLFARTPVIEPEGDGPAPAGDDGDGKGTYLAFTRARLRELACFAAQTGRPLAEPLSQVAGIADAHRRAMDTEYNTQFETEKARIDRLDADFAAVLSPGTPHPSFSTPGVLKVELERWSSTSAQHIRMAVASAKEEQRNADRQEIKELAAIENDWLDSRIGPAQRVLQIYDDEWTAKKDETRRQAEVLTAVKDQYQAALDNARERVEVLHRLGITRHVSGFLVWASTASLFGAGMAVSQVVKRTLIENQARPTLLQQWLGGVQSPLQWLSLLAIVVAVLVGIVMVVGLVTMLTRRLLRSDADAGAARVPLNAGEKDGNWLGWLGIFGPRGVAPSGVTDYSLQQLLGSLPLVLAGGIVAFVFISFGDRKESGVSILASHLGPTFVTLSIVTTLLFITNVLGARSEASLTRWRAIFFGALALAPPLSLALVGAPVVSKEIGLASFALAMTLGASGLAFGLMYRGQFAREEYLEAQVHRYDARLTALLQPPTLAALVSHAPIGPMANAVSRALHDHTLAARRRLLRDAWFNFVRYLKRLIARQGPFATVDSEYPEASILQDLVMTKERRDVIHDALVQRDQLRARWERLTTIEDERKKSEERLAAARSTHTSKTCVLSVEHAKAILELKTAYEIARTSLEGFRPTPPDPFDVGPLGHDPIGNPRGGIQ